jgi:hypothetical protein
MGLLWSNPVPDLEEAPQEELYQATQEELYQAPQEEMYQAETTQNDTVDIQVLLTEHNMTWSVLPPEWACYERKTEDTPRSFWLRSFHWVLADVGVEQVETFDTIRVVYDEHLLSKEDCCYLTGLIAAASTLIWNHPLREVTFVPRIM